MKLHLLSDLHLECFGFKPPAVDADLVVLAGDIATGADGIEWAAAAFPGKQVVYVPGNHEFYGWEMNRCLSEMARAAQASPNVTLCNGHGLTYQGPDGRAVRILGLTLWTDFAVFGAHNVEKHGTLVSKYLADYRAIWVGSRLLTWRDTLALHRQGLAWLKEECRAARERGETVVVVSHHGPSLRSSHAMYQNDAVTAGFLSNLEEFAAEYVDVWVHGHVHHSTTFQLGDCRVVTNPRGYPHSRHNPATKFENPAFNPALVVTV
jgi:predicted phosphodiesterase